MDYATQWTDILEHGSVSRGFLLILPDFGGSVSLRGVESAGDNGSDKDAAGWSYEHTFSIHSLTVPAASFRAALQGETPTDCQVEMDGKRYWIVSVTGTDILGTALRLYLRPAADEGDLEEDEG